MYSEKKLTSLSKLTTSNISYQSETALFDNLFLVSNYAFCFVAREKFNDGTFLANYSKHERSPPRDEKTNKQTNKKRN